MSNQLRSYQVNILNKIFQEFESNTSVLLQMPTGTGKTSVFCVLIKKWINENFPNKRVLILVHRKELVDQIIYRLKTYGILAARIQAGHETELTKQVQVGLIQSLKKPEKLPKNLSLIVIDEAHHTPSNSYRELLKHYEKHSPKILGVTATPCRINGSGFADLFDKLIVSDSIIDFINNGYLSPIKHLATSIPDLSSIKIDYRRNDFDEKELEKIMRSEQIMAELIESYITYGENKKAIVFAINKAHSKDIVERYNSEGINAIYIDSDSNKEDRELIVKEFKEGKYKILCNVNIFTEGFDCPDVEVVQLARPTKSLSLYLQQVGRCMRPFPGKEYGLILDNACLWETHGLISSDFEWSLSKPVKIKKGKSKVSKKNKKAAFEFVAHEMLGLELEEIEILTPKKNEIEKEVEIISDNLLPYFEVLPDFVVNYLLPQECYEFEDFLGEDYLNEKKEADSIDDLEFVLNTDLQLLSLNGKFGIYDTGNKETLLENDFDFIGKPDVFSNSLIIKENLQGLFNCINKKIILEPIYESIDKKYFIKTGNLIKTETEIDEIGESFSTINTYDSELFSFFIITKNEKYGLIKYSNNQTINVLECFYDLIIVSNHNLDIINAKINKKWYLYDDMGVRVYLGDLELLKFNNTDCVFVQYKKTYGVLNQSKEFLDFPFIIKEIQFKNNCFIAKYLNGLFDVLDEDFIPITDGDLYSNVELINDQFIRVTRNKKIGVIDFSGNLILEIKYDHINYLSDNSFVVFDKVWQIIKNKEIIFESNKRKKAISHFNNLANTKFAKNPIKKPTKTDKLIEKVESNFKLKSEFIKNQLENVLESKSDESVKIRDVYKDLRITKNYIEDI